MKHIILVLIFFHTIVLASEECSKIDSCNYTSMWADFSKLEVTYSNSKGKKGSTFVYHRSDNEALMTFDTRNGIGNVLSIRGVATLWHGMGTTGIKKSQSCYEDVEDSFAIIQSYALRTFFFLGYGVKGGPELVHGIVDIDLSSDQDTRVQINPGDHMMIGGPWSLKGYVKKENETISFEILHKFVARGEPASLYLTGTWTNTSVPIPVDSSSSLDEWLVCMSNKYAYDEEKSVFIPLKEGTSNIKTIEGLRTLTKHRTQ